MAIIAQKPLFGWEEIGELGDLKRLQLVMEHLPDEELMRALEKERYRGRNDYPVRGVWNSILAGIVFQHNSIASLRRELGRNAQMRELCGLAAVFPAWVYTRLLKKLFKHNQELEDIFEKLVSTAAEVLPEFGKRLVFDGKAI